MSSFQRQVRFDQASLLVGELDVYSPNRTKTWTVTSINDPEDIVIGRAFVTASADPRSAIVGTPGSVVDYPFVGILILPKTYASHGNSVDGTLASVMNLKQNTIGELCTMGKIGVHIENDATIGFNVEFDDVGKLYALQPGNPVTSGRQLIPNCVVTRGSDSNSGPAVITITN